MVRLCNATNAYVARCYLMLDIDMLLGLLESKVGRRKRGEAKNTELVFTSAMRVSKRLKEKKDWKSSVSASADTSDSVGGKKKRASSSVRKQRRAGQSRSIQQVLFLVWIITRAIGWKSLIQIIVFNCLHGQAPSVFAVGLACGDQRRREGSGTIQTVVYFTLTSWNCASCSQVWHRSNIFDPPPDSS